MIARRLLSRRVPSSALQTPIRRHFRVTAPALANFNKLNEQDLSHFASILPESSILSTVRPFQSTNDDLAPFNNDWMGKYHGKSQCVLKPRTTEEVSRILKWCWERRIPVVPQGGNTGLVGGSVPLNDEVIINLSNMSKVRSFDPVSGIIVCDAGCILENLSEYLAPHKYIMPIDLGAKGSCQIGGNVSTNAGGLRLLRYGSLHGTVLGLEVVLPDGSVMNELKTLRKDNTGYDLKQLFIGAEGTLGIITGVSILAAPAPASSQNLVLSLESYDKVAELFKFAKTHLSEILSAFEYWDRRAYDMVCKHTGRKALDESEVGNSQAFVLIETSGGSKEHDEAKVANLLELLYSAEEPLITSGTLSQSPSQFTSLWGYRELIPEAASKEGKTYKYDISVPATEFASVVDKVKKELAGKGLMQEGREGGWVRNVIGFGHVGDGNLHLNVIANAFSADIQAALEPYVFELVASYNGSISAEHGIGAMKTQHLHYSKGQVSIDMMRRIKALFDERGIMNPGKVVEGKAS
ncbi:hypothetical protein BOTBODRAFT_191727 [Botryobasidium botryosum FD-172 SS1]|uniref:FAD-binding PCMH-type domain-containing protein n=1 Tax=Botryobasidium botryosum (strain FD-172 SS1) TaxID=930990 RepID=A0A067M9B8_BOTB1|nr:hypothetical protein BOTBODRAFT_191727 [Botryobasidium botryosum FD-172 SS1]